MSAAEPADPEFDRLYPALAALRRVRAESQAVGEFLEWLGTRSPPLFLARYLPDRNFPVPDETGAERLLAEYHGIDLRAVEAEKRRLLQSAREAGGVPPAAGGTPARGPGVT